MHNPSLNSLKITLVALMLSGLAPAFAQDDGAFLDPAYSHLRKVTPRGGSTNVFNPRVRPFDRPALILPAKSDVLGVIASQTPVRSQAARGTCSIFSATALLEGQMVRDGLGDVSLDLSEEWLEYVKAAETGGEGSSSPANINYFRRYGTVKESEMAYVGETWDSVGFSAEAAAHCGELTGFDQKKCLIGHRDPRLLRATDDQLNAENDALFDLAFLGIRRAATLFRDQVTANLPAYAYVSTEDDVKALLAAGTPVLLDIDFYYGAWNHRVGPELGIERNLEHWAQGLVGYPEAGSVDRAKSKEDPAGHSILLVGYSDEEEITVASKLTDGTTKTFTYRGVYYFKNSWGTASFGAQTSVDGQTVPGYGKITQKYAHDFGGFYAWNWR